MKNDNGKVETGMKRIAKAVGMGAVALGMAVGSAGMAHADPAGNAVCRLLAAGNTPDGLANSVTVRQVLGPDATAADARVYVRTVVAGQCPQFLWRF